MQVAMPGRPPWRGGRYRSSDCESLLRAAHTLLNSARPELKCPGGLSDRPALHDVAQPCAIGYFAKISSTRLNAFSAAAWGVIPPIMMSAQPTAQTCSFWTWA